MDYKLTNYEKETTILYNDDEKHAICYTCNAALMRKLDRFVEARPDIFQQVKSDSCSKTYHFPKKLVTIRLPKEITDEQKQKMSERMRAWQSQNLVP